MLTIPPPILKSHPSRGEWIEMRYTIMQLDPEIGLTPRGVSGLK